MHSVFFALLLLLHYHLHLNYCKYEGLWFVFSCRRYRKRMEMSENDFNAGV